MNFFTQLPRAQIKNIVLMLIIGGIYFVAGKFGLRLAFVNQSATAIWAPTGIALASYILFGYRVWPAIFLGAFFTNVTTTGSFIPSVGIALGNTLEGLIGAYLINIFAQGKQAFFTVPGIVRFTIVAILCTTLSANIGFLSLLVSRQTTWGDFIPIWFTWWMGDTTGALIVTPLIIFWSKRGSFKWKIRKIVEAGIVFYLLIIVSLTIFVVIPKPFPIEFLCIPFILWIAFRFGRRETMSAIVLLLGIAIWGTLHRVGPFAGVSPNQSLLLLQSFMSVITLTVLILGCAVAEKNTAEEEIKSREERFRSLIENSSDAISLTDPTGKITYVSPSFTRILGFTPEEVIGKNGASFILPSDIPRAQEIISHIVEKQNKSVSLVIRCYHKDGSFRYVEITITNLMDNPSVGAVVSNFYDVTERMVMEETEAREKAEDEALLASIGDGIVATDPEGRIILVNPAFEELMGWKKSEVVGKQAAEILLMHDEKGKPIEEKDRPLYQALFTKKKITGTHYLARKNQTSFPAFVTATPVLLNKETIGAIKVIRDITKEKEIDSMKNEFVALASHQLKTPLTSIKWYSELLLKKTNTQLTEKQVTYLQEIHKSNKRMIYLINALLNVSRIDLGTFMVNPIEASITEIIDGVINEFLVPIHERNVQLEKQYATDIPRILLDANVIHIIFSNLILNAIRYTAINGKVSISITQDGQQIHIAVADNGIGIPLSERGKIFKKFSRADNAKIQNTDGSGLGLYMVKSLVDQTGGTITFTSEEDKGTTFTVSFPLSGMKDKHGTRQLQ